MVSTKVVRQGLYQKLNVSAVTSLLGSGSASLVHGVALGTAAYPLCVFHKQSGISDLVSMGGDDARNMLWLVKGVVNGSSSSVAEDIDKAVNDLLHFGSLTLSTGDLMHMARESDFEFVETVGDKQYRHHGGLYRLVVQD